MKLLSIVIPVYNTEHYIRRCLDSILVPETLEAIEVLVINDGSKDKSASIAKEYEAKYPNTVKVIDKENGGHGSTINKGLELATGSYFRVLDSDDWFDTLAFIRYLDKLKDCTEDIVLTPYYQEYVYNGMQILYEYPGFEFDRTYTFADVTLEKLNDFYFVLASSSYKTEVLRSAGVQLFEKTFYVDMQYNIMAVKDIKTIRFLNDNIYRYFIGRPTQSMSIASMIRNMPHHERVLKFLVEYYRDHKAEVEPEKRIYMANMIKLMTNTHFHLISDLWKNRWEAYQLSKGFMKYLKKTDKELYQAAMDYPYIRLGQKLGYLNVLLCNKLYLKALGFGVKLKGRLGR